MLTQKQREHLQEHGYVLLERLLPLDLLQEIKDRLAQIVQQEGEQAGAEFKQEPGAVRLANLVNKGDVFVRCVSRPEVLEAVGVVLGPDFKLSSLNYRSTNPHSEDAQPLHVDMGLLPDEHGNPTCNTIWMLDEFTPENGATRFVPGSHRWAQRPQEALADSQAPHPDEQLITGPAGSICIMNAALWHGGTANRTSHPRAALHSFYVRRDVPQQQYQKQLLDQDLQARLTPELRDLLALDDPLNDELSRSTAPRSGFLR